MPMRTYSPDQIAVNFGGIRFSGFASGTFVEVERDEDAFTPVIGADGFSTRTQSKNRGATITVTLMASSPTNDLLMGVAIADEMSRTGVREFSLEELNGGTRMTAARTWIQKRPKIEFGKELTDRTWVFRTDAAADYFVGGINPL
jgi:hypothetical protein